MRGRYIGNERACKEYIRRKGGIWKKESNKEWKDNREREMEGQTMHERRTHYENKYKTMRNINKV